MTIAVEERTVGIQELVVPHGRVEQPCARNIAEEHTKSDRQQQQRLVLFLDGQIKKEAGDADHHRILPALANEKLVKPISPKNLPMAEPKSKD